MKITMKISRQAHGRGHRSRTITAGALFHLPGLAWPLMIPVLQHLLHTGELPMHPGGNFRVLGGGFIETVGARVVITSILFNSLSSTLDVLAGHWLWKSERRGAILGLGTRTRRSVTAG